MFDAQKNYIENVMWYTIIFTTSSATDFILVDSIKNLTFSGTPLLGICLGMQLLMENSEEGSLNGIGLINGTAKMIHEEDLLIPAGKEVVLESGGSHFMLMGPRRDIEVGQIIKMIVLDKRETRYMFDLKVIDPRKAHGHDHHMH